jgi:hypothetical protein
MKLYISLDYMEYDIETRNLAETNICDEVAKKYHEPCSPVPHTDTMIIDCERPVGEKAARLIRVLINMQSADAVVVPDNYYEYFTCLDDIAIAQIFNKPLIKSNSNWLSKY